MGSVWDKEPRKKHFSPLTKNITTNTLIVGGGMAKSPPRRVPPCKNQGNCGFKRNAPPRSPRRVKFRGKLNMRMWRNRQTRQIQVLVVAILCGFKSLHPHQESGYFSHFFLFLQQIFPVRLVRMCKSVVLSVKMRNCYIWERLVAIS